MKKIASLLIGEIKYDGRVQKEIQTLMELGYETELIVSKFLNDNFNNYKFKIYVTNTDINKSVPNTVGKFKFCFQAFNILKVIKPDIVHCNDLCTLYAGVLYKRFNSNCRLIYDAHELYPEMFSKNIVKKFWKVVEKRYIKCANEIISPEPNRASYMKKLYSLKNDVNVIENFPRKKKLNNSNVIEEKIPSTKNRKKILYLGAIISDRNIEDMILAFKHLNNEFCLILIGKFLNDNYKQKIIEIINKNNLQNKVYILKPVPNNEVIYYINSSDIGLVFYKNNNLNNYYCASNKLYEFITCNKKIITNDYPGLVSVVKNENLGICLNKINSETIFKSILYLETNKIENKNVLETYYWESNLFKFKKIYGF